MNPSQEPLIEHRNGSVPNQSASVTSGPDVLVSEGATVNLPWYVVHTKVRQEQIAFDNLARQGYTAYLPRIKILKRSRGRQQAQLEPLFPRYTFFQPGSAAQSIAPVRSTLGVTTIVRFGQEPAVMRPETLMGIRDFEARQNQSPDEDISPFQRGGRVRVVDGPLTGFEGLISVVSRERVVVLMQLLGQDTRVSLSHHQLLIAA
jgi:transcriptional antiterminator RfaH